MTIATQNIPDAEPIPLNPQQIKFVKAYAATSNATEAARRAGYAKASVGSQGSRLMQRSNIKAGVEREKRRIGKRADLDADKVLERLDQTRQNATDDGQHGVAARCIQLQGMHIGMFGETHRHEHHVEGEVKLVAITDTVNELLIRQPGKPCLLDYERGDAVDVESVSEGEQ